jgi:hypothetical protein
MDILDNPETIPKARKSIKRKPHRKPTQKTRQKTRQKTTIKKHSKNKKHSKKRGKTRKSSICAPYINPTDISGNSNGNTDSPGGFTQDNINIIKSATDESCFTIEALRKIADKWNTTYPDMKIEYTMNTTGKSLWNSINNVMRSQCNSEVCWVKQPFIKQTPLQRELLRNFKPLMPKSWEDKPTEWLNTIDIRDVMNQYETKYPDFEFIGPVPMDFDSKVGFGQCVVSELCQINLKTLVEENKKTRLGVVFNLDKHNQPGSHWVAMFMSWNSGQCCYWDSYGMKPAPEIVNLMERLKEQGAGMGKPITIKINNIRHQYKNSECGVYCIYFLTSLLAGRTFESIIRNVISDDRMNAKRNDFFIKNE